jgi:hypothetical protein
VRYGKETVDVTRHVKGVLFLDYVRMIRREKSIDWAKVLEPEDFAHVVSRVEPDGWYPMAVFERLGEAIFRTVAQGQMMAVRMWGQLSVDPLLAATPGLLSQGDPIETLMRMRVFRSTFFDFEALTIPTLVEDHAEIIISYQMGPIAEEAASHQTMGFFERLIEIASGARAEGFFKERSWDGGARTLLVVRWEAPSSR